MFCIYSGLLSGFNILTLVVSIPIVGVAWFLQTYGKTDCDCYLHVTLLTLGVFLLVMSLIGLIGSCCRVTLLLWLYLWVMSLLIVWVLFSTVSGLVAMHQGEGEVTLQKGHDEYRVEQFSDWLQSNVLDNKYWTPFKSCLIEAQVCSNLDQLLSNVPPKDYMESFPIQWGCCKPPFSCGFEHKNATFWTVPKSGLAATDLECITWSNHQDTLCYDCNSCKAGFLAILLRHLRRLTYFNFGLLVYLIVNLTIACYAFRSNRTTDQYMKYAKELVQKA